MNTREAYAALAAGKKIISKPAKLYGGSTLSMDMDGRILLNGRATESAPCLTVGMEFEIVEEPATDEELVAAMKRCSDHAVVNCAALAYAHCANMLKTRKVRT